MGQQQQLFSGGKHATAIIDQTAIEGAVDGIGVRNAMGPVADEVWEALVLLDGAGEPFDLTRVRAGRQTPVFFGSALAN